MNSSHEYFYIDIQLPTMKIVNHGTSQTATLTGDTENKAVHRIFLTKGQYQKFIRKL